MTSRPERARPQITFRVSPTRAAMHPFTMDPRPVDPVHRVFRDERAGPALERLRTALDLNPGDLRGLLGAYLPLAALLDRLRADRSTPLVVGVNGAQGSGKTTLGRLLEVLLQTVHGLRVVCFSIDDFYLTRDQRASLAVRVHPLLGTRGVPGTHDVALGRDVLGRLVDGSGGTVAIPRFDKAVDDRMPTGSWRVVQGPVDVVLFEGWCVGALPQAEDSLEEPINELEAKEDEARVWRRFVNAQLAGPYEPWFGALDLLVFLRVPDFDHVRAWRRLQEEKLARRRPGAAGLMDAATLDRFLMLYERTTRHALDTLPRVADVVCAIDTEHHIERIGSSFDLSLADRGDSAS